MSEGGLEGVNSNSFLIRPQVTHSCSAPGTCSTVLQVTANSQF